MFNFVKKNGVRMFHKIILVTGILLTVGGIMVMNHFAQPFDLIKKYQKLGLVESDLRYEKVEKAWGDQGLIFYQVQLPFVAVPVQADRMTLSLADTGMQVKFRNIRIHVIEGLKKKYGSDLENNLNRYVPYQDFFSHLLTSLAVMGIDDFMGDMALNTVYSDAKTMRFTIEMKQKRQPVLKMEGVIHIPLVGAHQLSDLWNGQINDATIQVEESFFDRYVNYAKSRRLGIPDFFKKGMLKIKNSPALKNILN